MATEFYELLGSTERARFYTLGAQSIQSCSKSIAIENSNRGLNLLQNQSFGIESCIFENQSRNQPKQIQKINRKINREINHEINRQIMFGCSKYVHIYLYVYLGVLFKASMLGLSSPYMCHTFKLHEAQDPIDMHGHHPHHPPAR